MVGGEIPVFTLENGLIRELTREEEISIIPKEWGVSATLEGNFDVEGAKKALRFVGLSDREVEAILRALGGSVDQLEKLKEVFFVKVHKS